MGFNSAFKGLRNKQSIIEKSHKETKHVTEKKKKENDDIRANKEAQIRNK
jgi:hypothetical protein